MGVTPVGLLDPTRPQNDMKSTIDSWPQVPNFPSQGLFWRVLLGDRLHKKASIRWQDSGSQFQATGQPVSRTQASEWRNDVTAAGLWGEVCATQVLPMRVGPFAFRYQGNGAIPCQYIDTTQKAIDRATTLPPRVFI